MATLEAAATVFPVIDIERAMSHYASLGFDVTGYDGDEAYAYARRDNVRIHLWEAPTLDPAENFASAFVYVDDADELATEWRRATDGRGYDSPTSDPVDTEYGLREGAHVDPDGNLIRFAHPLGGRRDAAASGGAAAGAFTPAESN
ncbi:bleomycin resistance protein [Zafaria sp. Z1313]|uniref:bleomycin resistance protein n=1 Tax=unclassified Zafaria TaxID=2828765 RepID=UPI002E75D300|nr:VOC family protein [Zafaria sp. J156]MEE1621994.1 VOC family protein [Zafaria sp. J156]